jgi:hypothetical protein
LEELKRRSSTRQSKGRRSNLLDIDTVRNFRASGARISGETSEESTPRTSDVGKQEQKTSEEKSCKTQMDGMKSCEQSRDPSLGADSGHSSMEMLTRIPILDPDERPLDVGAGRPARSTFTFIAFDNEKTKSPGLGNPEIKKTTSVLPRKQLPVPTKDNVKGKSGPVRKTVPCNKKAGKDTKLNAGNKAKQDTDGKSDEAEITQEEEEPANMKTAEAVEKVDELQKIRRGTFFVPKEKETKMSEVNEKEEGDKMAKNRRGTFAITKPDVGQKGPVKNQNEVTAGTANHPNPDVELNDVSGNDSLGILNTTILGEVDMEFTLYSICPSTMQDPTPNINKDVVDAQGEENVDAAEHVASPAEVEVEGSVPEDVEMIGLAPPSGHNVNEETNPSIEQEVNVGLSEDAPNSRDSRKMGSAKSDESSDEGKKDKKFAVFHLKPGKIQFIAGRKDANGNFKIPKPMARLKSRALSRSKNRSCSKQKAKPIELPMSNPPSTFDFLGLTPEKPLTTSKSRTKTKEKKSSAEECSSNEEGRIEFNNLKTKKKWCEGGTSSDTTSGKAQVNAKNKSRTKKKRIIASSSDASFSEDDSHDEDFVPPPQVRRKSSIKTGSRTRRQTVTIVAPSASEGEPVKLNTTFDKTVVPSVEEEEPTKLNTTYEKTPVEGKNVGDEIPDGKSHAKGMKTSHSDLSCDEHMDQDEFQACAAKKNRKSSLKTDSKIRRQTVTVPILNTTFEKPSGEELEKVEKDVPVKDGDHKSKKNYYKKVLKNKTHAKTKKTKEPNSGVSCEEDNDGEEDHALPVSNKRQSVVKNMRRQTSTIVEPPVCEDEPTELNETFEIPSVNVVEPVPDSRVDDEVKGDVPTNVKHKTDNISLPVDIPIGDDSIGDISNFWDKKELPKKEEPVGVIEKKEGKKSKLGRTKRQESCGEQKAGASNKVETNGLEGSQDCGVKTNDLDDKADGRKFAKNSKCRDTDMEVEKVVKRIKKEPRSSRTKDRAKKPDVTLGDVLVELDASGQEDVDAAGLTVMLEDLGDKLDMDKVCVMNLLKIQ